MLTNITIVFICVRASSAFRYGQVRFLQPVVRGQVYIFEISPPLTQNIATKYSFFNTSHKLTYFIPSYLYSVRSGQPLSME